MKDLPLVSVGIPAFNAEKFIAIAVQSVLLQTYTNFELIVINDGSTDHTEQVLKRFSDPRLRIISDGTNKGLIARLNEMANLSKGDFFVRMDADDIMFPCRIERQIQFLMKNPQVAVCCSSAVSIDKNNKVLGLKKAVAPGNRKDVLSGIFPVHPTVCGRMSFFRKYPYREGFFQMEDKELWYRSIEENKFGCIAEPLLFYREDSIPNSGKHKRMYKGLQKFVQEYIKNPEDAKSILNKSRQKYLIYRILETFGLESIIIKRRFQNIKSTESYDEILRRINERNKNISSGA